MKLITNCETGETKLVKASAEEKKHRTALKNEIKERQAAELDKKKKRTEALERLEKRRQSGNLPDDLSDMLDALGI